MTQWDIDEELLSVCVPCAEQLMLDRIPPEQTLQRNPIGPYSITFLCISAEK